jgi:hypothetical protein
MYGRYVVQRLQDVDRTDDADTLESAVYLCHLAGNYLTYFDNDALPDTAIRSSFLADTPGMDHFPDNRSSPQYARRVLLEKLAPLVDSLRAAGFEVELPPNSPVGAKGRLIVPAGNAGIRTDALPQYLAFVFDGPDGAPPDPRVPHHEARQYGLAPLSVLYALLTHSPLAGLALCVQGSTTLTDGLRQLGRHRAGVVKESFLSKLDAQFGLGISGSGIGTLLPDPQPGVHAVKDQQLFFVDPCPEFALFVKAINADPGRTTDLGVLLAFFAVDHMHTVTSDMDPAFEGLQRLMTLATPLSRIIKTFAGFPLLLFGMHVDHMLFLLDMAPGGGGSAAAARAAARGASAATSLSFGKAVITPRASDLLERMDIDLEDPMTTDLVDSWDKLQPEFQTQLSPFAAALAELDADDLVTAARAVDGPPMLRPVCVLPTGPGVRQYYFNLAVNQFLTDGQPAATTFMKDVLEQLKSPRCV